MNNKRRRAKTRRQREIRRKRQVDRQTAHQPGTAGRERRSDGRKAQRRAEEAALAGRYRTLTRLLRLSLVAMLYGVGICIAQLVAGATIAQRYPWLWTPLLIALGVLVAACMVVGLLATVREREWVWVAAIAIPLTTVPALFLFSSRRRQAIRAGTVVRPVASRPTPVNDDVRLLGDR